MTDRFIPDGFERVDGFEPFNDLEPVPGSGPIRGVWVSNGDVYASRDNADASAIETYKATADGWVLHVVGA